eukprot:CAMPEP_0194029174 /NCGR_PEP_ID=MMETSP0009_2-20130614/2986_1 /TAXON_ID=210454 /ORGANISM="Grammatophora oceanica, Strain CCMP 410" /LENGTH=387 /DNA_ID=CAMNT_0038668779 /DNA_START=108 /DNA_END=1271 /DNA_ORIENTATION=+
MRRTESPCKSIPSPPFLPSTTLVLVDGALAAIQKLTYEYKTNNIGVSVSTGHQLALNSDVCGTSSGSRNADKCLMEPLPFKEGILIDDTNMGSKKRTLKDTSDFINLASYTANLDDPFAPRPIVVTDDEGVTFVEENSTEQPASSPFSLVTEDEDEDEAERYFEIAGILKDDFGEQSSHPNMRPRLFHQELGIIGKEETIQASHAESPPTPPPSPEHYCANNVDTIQSETFRDVSQVLSTGTDPTDTQACDEGKAMDASAIMARLDQLMFQSELTQSALQFFDKQRGLPKSHCQTMVNSSRSRKQLLEGKIIKKWNGRPLLGEESEALSIKSEAGPRRKRRRRNQSTHKPTISTSNDSDFLPENISSENKDATKHHERPKRRMSAPP